MAAGKFFALEMPDGNFVRDIFELREHFDFKTVEKYFRDGKLLTWLADRYYDEEALAVEQLSADDANLEKKLCAILEVPTAEEKKRAERLDYLKCFTDDEKILEHVDSVAFNQEELAYLLDEGVREIYLCDNRFVIPLRMNHQTYIGVSNAVAVIRSKEPVDFAAFDIEFKNIKFDDAYKKILPATEKISDGASTVTPVKGNANFAEARTTIVNVEGIHARPASLFVQKANSFKSKVKLSARGKTIDAKSILPIMSAGWGFGTEVTVTAEGSDAQQAVAELVALIDSGFGREVKKA